METPEIDAYSQPRRIQPGCQHNLGCKCGIPYYLRPSSEAELRRERVLQLSSAQLEFISTALSVVEAQRNELKSACAALRIEVDGLRKQVIPDPSPG